MNLLGRAIVVLSLALAPGLMAHEIRVAQGSTPGELKAQMEQFLSGVEEPDTSSPLRALQIRADKLASFPRGGPDSIAGVGDWWLSNGIVCVAVSGLGHDAGIVAGGGTLIDVGHCEARNDQWTYANLLTGLAKETAISIQRIEASVEEGVAEIVTYGEADGLRQTLRYRLEEGAETLQIRVQIERIGKGRPLRMSGLFTLYSQRALTPFALSSYSPSASLGFSHPDIDRSKISSLIKGLKASDWNILVGADSYASEISYGLQLRSAELVKANGSRQALPRFLAVFPDYSLHGWMSRPLWLHSDELGWLAMLQNQLMDIERGEQLQAEFRLALGARSEVAAITDQIYRGPQLRGYSNEPGVSFAVRDERGRPVTQVRAGSDGSFNIRLPKGIQRVSITALAPWGQEISRELSIDDARNDSGRWLFDDKGQLQLPRGEAMSLSFFGLGDTADPQFGRDLLGLTRQGQALPTSLQSNRVDLAGTDGDPTSVDLLPGQYRVLSSRGFEYDVREYLLTVVAGKTSTLPIVPPRRIWHQGEDWLSADLHVHSGASFDSTLPFAQRLRSFAAQGAELLVPSEHNRVVDYQQQLQDMGLQEGLQIVSGVELTGLARTDAAPFTIGHSNVFPVQARPAEHAGGMIGLENRRLRSVIAEAKQQWPGALFQLNHPRAVNPLDADLAFFDHLSQGRGYDADQPLMADANRSLLEVDEATGFRDIDFDIIEIVNGAEFSVYPRLREDWFSLLNQGAIRTATGNSDSHGLGQVVAAPRNYIHLPQHGPLPVAEEKITAALAQGRSYLTTGPLMTVLLRRDDGRQVGLGGRLQADRAALHIQVDAAPWVPIDTISVWVNGELYRQLDAAAGDHKVVEVIAKRDAYVVVEVTGKASARYREVLPGLAPLALSNPIFMDADGDGKWSPPRALK